MAGAFTPLNPPPRSSAFRDDSAGEYGVYDDSNLSWLDYAKAKASDFKDGAFNGITNLAGALNVVGTSPGGDMSLQVPPMISGAVDSFLRLAGTPSNPGNAYDLTGVDELDAPIKSDMNNVLLSIAGGNAVGGLTKPRGSLGSSIMKDDFTAPPALQNVEMKNGVRRAPFGGTEQWTVETPEGMVQGNIDKSNAALRINYSDVKPQFQGRGIRTQLYRQLIDEAHGDGRHVISDMDVSDSASRVYDSLSKSGYRVEKNPAAFEVDGATRTTGRGVYSLPPPNYTGETLFSDTGKPSILGSALATAGELPMDLASRMARAKEIGFDTDKVFYHGPNRNFDSFDPKMIGSKTWTPMGAPEGFWFTDDPQIAGRYAKGDNGSIMPVYLKDPQMLASGRVAVAGDPRNIRSVNAAFDPSKSDSANLLAAQTGGLPMLPQEDEQLGAFGIPRP